MFHVSFCNADITSKNIAKFIAGATTGLVIHEAGHYVAAEFTGTPITWTSPVSFNFDEKPNAIVASAGIAANMVTTEIILNTNTDRDNWYIFGFLTFSILEPIMYIFRDQVFHNAPDIESIHKGGLSRDIVTPIIIGHTILSIYRAISKNRIPAQFGIGKDRVGFNIIVDF